MEETLRIRILQETIQIFNDKGLKCTMDDIAKGCGISKKTIYTVFSDKIELFLAMVDYLFDGIKREQQMVLDKMDMDVIDKIRGVMSVMPESYIEIDFTKLSDLKDKFPEVYERVKERLESGWETTLFLMEQARGLGIIREDTNTYIIKMMFEASLEHFFQSSALEDNHMTYQQALAQVVDILIDGILVKNSN